MSWYIWPITALGLTFAVEGALFFVFVTHAGAPYVPWLGWMLAAVGAWMAWRVRR